jgi:adenine-specific DNA-methyltransferase
VNDALALCRESFARLLPYTSEAVSRFASTADGARTLSDFAEQRGFEDDPQHETIARQAALLALLAAVRCEMDGGADPQVPVCELMASVSARHRQRFVLTPLTDVLALVDRPVGLNLADLAAQLRRTPYEDVIGDMYAEAVPQSERRKLGQFWTPRPIADLMCRWAIRAADSTVLDPAAGAGMLLLAAMQRLDALGGERRSFPALLHGNDVDALVQALSYVTMSAYSDSEWENVLLADALTTRTQPADAIVCNPPYTRHHHLPDSYKQQLRRQVQQTLGIRLNGFTSLYAYFFCHALTLLDESGRMAFITPAELFDASYAKPIKRHVVEHVNLRAVIMFGDDFAAFPGVDTAGMITLVDGGACDGRPVRFVELTSWPGETALLDAVDADTDETFEWGHVEVRSRDQLTAMGKWAVTEQHRMRAHARAVPLISLARPMRGIASGNNRFFTLTDQERRQAGLPDTALRPSIAKTRDCLTLSFTDADHREMLAAGKKGWLFYFQQTLAEADDAVAAYVREGETAGVHEGALVSLRRHWYQIERRQPPPILFTYLSRGWPRFIANDVGALNLNGFHSIYVNAEIAGSRLLRSAFLAILNSETVLGHLRSLGRSYGGGTVKVEPGELDQLPVIDPRTLDGAVVAELAGEFDRSCRLHPSQFSEARARIDAMLSAIV